MCRGPTHTHKYTVMWLKTCSTLKAAVGELSLSSTEAVQIISEGLPHLLSESTAVQTESEGYNLPALIYSYECD